MNKTIKNSGFKDWKPEQLPDLTGKIYLITGGNSGIGLEAAKMLAEKNADIVIACRNPQKAEIAIQEIKPLGSGKVESVTLDLSKLSSVRSAAEEIKQRYSKLDALINNAGIMQTPKTITEDGFELQLATNHLGHFLLTGLLFDLLEKAKGRIVVLSSIAHKFGKINFDDLMMEKSYTPTNAYTQSKLANLMFMLELNRRLQSKNSSVVTIACHPGYSATNLVSTGPKGLLNFVYKFSNAIIAQSSYNGAIPTVLSAAGIEAFAGGYYGPKSFNEMRGRVSDAEVRPKARDEAKAKKLWEVSEELVNFKWL
jgi:NAD(P)-dependent dehydrogenase (short-subunit alcohol dehydrogenase family)